MAVGREGEELASRWLRKCFPDLRDVRSVREWQERDIDFVAPTEHGGVTFEVKTDTYRTNNLALEVVGPSGRVGCFFRSRADWWVYLRPAVGDALVFKHVDAMNAVLLSDWPTKQARGIRGFRADGPACTLTVVLAPVDDFARRVGVARLPLATLEDCPFPN